VPLAVPKAVCVNDLLLSHFESQWKLLRGLSRDLLLSLSDDELKMSPGANLGPWWKQFRHVGRVQENYLNALATGTMKFGFEGTSYTGDPSNRSLDAYLERLDRRLAALIKDGSTREAVNWFGEPKSVDQHLLYLADHELLHHGQWIVYRKFLGGPFPKSWHLWGL
jgi:uncharacterized damage-inducible protein DinB